jgi:hypothetical protein
VRSARIDRDPYCRRYCRRSYGAPRPRRLRILSSPPATCGHLERSRSAWSGQNRYAQQATSTPLHSAPRRNCSSASSSSRRAGSRSARRAKPSHNFARRIFRENQRMTQIRDGQTPMRLPPRRATALRDRCRRCRQAGPSDALGGAESRSIAPTQTRPQPKENNDVCYTAPVFGD